MLQQIYPSVAHDFSYELNKDMHFASAHFVPHESAGACQNMHGHTYFANVTIAGDELDETGFLVNFQSLKKLVAKEFDHTLLNDHEAFDDRDPNFFPTTEVVARTIYERIQKHLDTLENKPVCLQVFLRETPTSYVVYRPKRGKKSES
ncbi:MULTISPECIES: 6-carboxytetrahydropterin synthase QueD [Priestia]|uniref:6-carboxy-5,6,7,8-tetrahydropterin synthase n=1 Tax=Priestia filamentosa TaxID=1402861 RepID=A0A1X7F0C9_9BACI|nr:MULTISPECIES: 6-carboxytetrahydropterin synthase QueD [Priestia]AKO91492.1 6-carboxytetrahydropterin synthase QueD [Priestia filamentosa]MCY8230759.1 6-carboxytetrahydropterin synthase QueD [Priestia endophytica]MDT3761591.1 6-carboxytetrahydropterin synthase QueD [Priestia filamentosa]OXS67688.1 6-carboxytetrahydropterin synthase QueD [Priestia filamentosa]RJS65108.1 6-carboxytetrahydropterin synthase QueD [Priestia filamentosa]